MSPSFLNHDGWAIGLIREPISSLLGRESSPEIEWLPLQRAHTFFADPFLIEHRSATYCFFEELSYRSNRGRISYVVLDERCRSPLLIERAITTPYHLSYPFLVRYEDDIFCIPESFESGRISIFGAREFPNGWYERATLLDNFAGVDPTVFEHGGRWWLFCTDARSAWNADLYAFYADDLFGRWRPHGLNPIKRDLRGSRPGGTPFVHGDRLFRPAQDCSSRYGGGLIINEILALSPDRFLEIETMRLLADQSGPFPDGFHTASGCGPLTAVDGNCFRFEPIQAARQLGGYVRRFLRSA